MSCASVVNARPHPGPLPLERGRDDFAANFRIPFRVRQRDKRGDWFGEFERIRRAPSPGAAGEASAKIETFPGRGEGERPTALPT